MSALSRPTSGAAGGSSHDQERLTKPPSVSLPTGGGAIRGIGEKFSANPVTGTGSMAVPLGLSPGRSGFGPQLSLNYDSGSGNGPFGLGWNLPIASIARKTDRGLPQYRDDLESDVFILAGAEDLVPILHPSGARIPAQSVTVAGISYNVRRYLPRVEGLFAWIERWTEDGAPGNSFWRTIGKDNITSWFGKSMESRVADPRDAARIYQWLLSETHDDKGNAVVYRYSLENADGVLGSSTWEANRAPEGRQANRYPKRILYGNVTPYLPALAPDPPATPLPDDWLFEAVFDYGDHPGEFPTTEASAIRPVRPDAFSTHRAGFEIRTYRRCERVLMFHHFEELHGTTLIRSTNFIYATPGDLADPLTPGYSTLSRVEHRAYVKDQHDQYHGRQLPPVTFRYSLPIVNTTLLTVPPDQLANLPVGTQGPGYEWVDLDGEGLPGILTEQGGAWYYKSNIGNGNFGPLQVVARRPSTASLASGQQLLDLAGDGAIDLVDFAGPLPGFHERDRDAGWTQFVPFASLPNIDWNEPNLRFLDLTGDGHADILITEDEVFTWYASLDERGFAAAGQLRTPLDEEAGPRVVFADGTMTMLLADMCGDGLTDLVRVRNGQVCYWPNLGYGRFGRKITLGNSPRFDNEDLYDPRRIRLADIDGGGPVDLIYLGNDGARLYFNRSGNSFSDAQRVPLPVATENLAAVQVADLMGNGTACLVWNSHLPADAGHPVRYIDLMGGQKPHLLEVVDNNLGGTTEIEYTPSTRFYIQDKLAGTPWITKLPFPVHCVSKVTARDKWRGTAFSTSYSYHHGYFDGVEREFRGFGRVEQVDVEDYGQFLAGNIDSPYITDAHELYQPPVKTITWYHTGVALDRPRVLRHFETEYFTARYRLTGTFHERDLPEPELPAALDGEEWREALRACKGLVLRQETYELDVATLASATPIPVRLFSAATHNCHIRRLQPRGANRFGVFHVTESEALTYNYELPLPAPGGEVTPDPRIAHSINLRVDEYGNVLETVSIGYPRQVPFSDATLTDDTVSLIRQVQGETHIAYGESRYTNDAMEWAGETALRYRRLRLPCETRTYELTAIRKAAPLYYAAADFVVEMGPPLQYHQTASGGEPQRRLVDHVRTLYFDEGTATIDAPLPYGQLGPRGLKFEDYKLALTDELLTAVFGDKLDQTIDDTISARSLLDNHRRSGYAPGPAIDPSLTGQYWQRSGIAGFAENAASHFYLPERYTDPFGSTTVLEFDARDLFIQSSTDAAGNRVEVLAFDYRTLAPREIMDINGNHTEAAFDVLGLVTAVAVKGKRIEGRWQGGHLDGFERSPRSRVVAFCASDTLDDAQARAWIGGASTRFVYHFGEAIDPITGVITWGVNMPVACAIVREQHIGQLGADEEDRLQVALECSDGGGNVLMKKVQAEPETETGPPRWIVNGLTVLNNKGKPVKQYEPFFSARFGCEPPREAGVTPVLYYDAAGRGVRTELPDGTFSRIEFSPWHARQFDASDTVLESAWYADRLRDDVRAEDRRAADLSAWHANTPGLAVLDSLGREVIAIAHNRGPTEDPAFSHLPMMRRPWVDERHVTHTKLDAEGKPLWIRDARGNLVMRYTCKRNDDPGDGVPAYDIAGNLLYQHSMDAGDRWMLSDAAGKPMFGWDVNDRLDAAGEKHPEARLAHTEYDGLHRPLRQWLKLGSAAAAVVERFEYRDTGGDPGLEDAQERNLIGQAVRHDDPSGRIELLRLDFTGKVQHEERRLVRHSTETVIDWQLGEGLLETETFTRRTRHDALGRMIQLVNWHRDAGRVAVYRPQYNLRGLLEAEDLSVGGEVISGAVHGITCDAKGQRTRLRHGNGAETRYAYDRDTFRLTQLLTTRPESEVGFPEFHSNLRDARVVQQLHYTYDAAGNISETLDEAWAPVFFRNQGVEPRSGYVYDALHRLIEATGRESARLSNPVGPMGEFFEVESFPSNETLRNYAQRYYYDSAGNFLRMEHSADRGSWTRHYETAVDSNRLLSTRTGSSEIGAIRYGYDTHGSMLNLDNVPAEARIRWDWRDMIEGMDLGGGGRAWYVYDSGKQRTRKRIERLNGSVEERLYLGGMELYRRYAPSGGLVEEIETHHLFVDDQRALLVDDVIETDKPSLGRGVLMRYQYGNHLGSVTLELDERARIIGCEELHPYGTTAYHLVGKGVRATAKRYRYTGMERDEETGLSYHSARYYAPWLGKWCSADAHGVAGGWNVYAYGGNQPIRLLDRSGFQSTECPGAVRAVGQTLLDIAFAAVALDEIVPNLIFNIALDPVGTLVLDPADHIAEEVYQGVQIVNESGDPEEAAFHFTNALIGFVSLGLTFRAVGAASEAGLAARAERAAAERAAAERAAAERAAAERAAAERAAAERAAAERAAAERAAAERAAAERAAAERTAAERAAAERTAEHAVAEAGTAVAVLSDEALIARVIRLHRQLVIDELGEGATAEMIRWSLSDSTLSIVETEASGATVRIVTTNQLRVYRALQSHPEFLQPGEVLGSRPLHLGRQYVHAEQLGLNDAVRLGGSTGRVATTWRGCGFLCQPLIRSEFPGFRHVNPAP